MGTQRVPDRPTTRSARGRDVLLDVEQASVWSQAPLYIARMPLQLQFFQRFSQFLSSNVKGREHLQPRSRVSS